MSPVKTFCAIVIVTCLSFVAGTYFVEWLEPPNEPLVVQAGPVDYVHLLHNNLGSGYVLVEIGVGDGEYTYPQVVRMTRREYIAIMNNADGGF